jgi:hypothetical protein
MVSMSIVALAMGRSGAASACRGSFSVCALMVFLLSPARRDGNARASGVSLVNAREAPAEGRRQRVSSGVVSMRAYSRAHANDDPVAGVRRGDDPS